MSNDKKYKHLTFEDRLEIQAGLNLGLSFKEIAKRIGKDPTTVSKEIKAHLVIQNNRQTKTDECCPLLLSAPFVCGKCDSHSHANCRYPHRYYQAKAAQKAYEETLSESRRGTPLNSEVFYRIDKIISTAVLSGQNIYHAIQANNLPISKSSVYRYIERGYYSISKIDLPRAVKFKPRNNFKGEYVPKGVKIGRSFDDFRMLLEANPATSYIEMDTVIGKPGGKVIMTFQFVNVNFMFGILLENKTATEAAEKIRLFKEKLSRCGFRFGEYFPVLLTDNGGEFSNVAAFENDLDGKKETLVYFCNPNAPYQKPHVENNHTMFRGIAGTGTSFDNFTQETVNVIFSHINSVSRKQFNGKSAYEMFTFTYSTQLASALGISYIEPKNVIQSPLLLKKYFPR